MIRTGYSYHVAFGHITEVVSRLKEIGWKHAPMADTMSTFGFRRWRDLCVKEGLKPVYGVELAVSPNPVAKKPIHDRWTFLAKDNVRSIHELVAKATSHNNPSLSYKEACTAQGVFKITGPFCLLSEMVAGPDIYFGLSPATPKQLFEAAYKLGYLFCAMSANVYPRESDLEAYRAMLGRRSNTQTYPQHILSNDEWHAAVDWFVPGVQQECAIINRDFILHRCHADLVNGEFIHPTIEKSLLTLCIEGAIRRGVSLSDDVYHERLHRELDIIEEKNFEDYFFIVADMIQHAKQFMIVGPGRGSSAGSLVCYLLGITNIDPIVHGTMFERFIDITRSDYPDIDSDFSDERREMVFDHMTDTYGSDHVARLGTVGMLQPKSALNNVGASLRIPKFEIEKVQKVVPKRNAGDERANLGVTDAFATEEGRKFLKQFPGAEIATRFEAHPANASQHAAGLLLTQNNILDVVAVDMRERAAMLDMKDAVEFNLLKIDVLGLTQLSIFERCLDLIGKPHSFLETLPLDKPEAYRMFQEHRFSGIFQWNGSALQGMTKQLNEVNCFNDLVVLTSIARPGVTEADVWIKRRNGAPWEDDSVLGEITRETLGIVVYQEQVLKIAREIGGLSWGDANKMRKTIAKTMGNEALAKFGEPFIEGAKANGVDENAANDIWQKLCRMGSYAFNKSHAVAYSVVSYYCAYLKAHYPVEFAAATLDAESDAMRQIAILRELCKEGVEYVAFNPRLSAERWTVVDQKLIGPLTNVRGIGPAAMREILDCRANGKEVRQSLLNKIEDATTPIDSLYPVTDAIERICPNGLADKNIFSEPTKIIDVLNETKQGREYLVIGVVAKVVNKDMNDKQSVAQRGYPYKGPSMTLNITIRDDSGEIMCKIGREQMENLAPRFTANGEVDKSIWAIKGELSIIKDGGYHWIKITNIRYLGDMVATKEEEVSRKFVDANTHERWRIWEKPWNWFVSQLNALGIKPPPRSVAIVKEVCQHISKERGEALIEAFKSGKVSHDSTADDIRDCVGELAKKH